MKVNQSSILMYGHNEQLLATRQWVLQSRGYRVVTLIDIAGFGSVPKAPPMRLLLLCHSLTLEECVSALAVAEARWPGIKSLTLESSVGRAPSGILGQLMYTLDGPATLISMVSELIGNSGSAIDPPAA